MEIPVSGYLVHSDDSDTHTPITCILLLGMAGLCMSTNSPGLLLMTRAIDINMLA